jgi:hypothetical protein
MASACVYGGMSMMCTMMSFSAVSGPVLRTYPRQTQHTCVFLTSLLSFTSAVPFSKVQGVDLLVKKAAAANSSLHGSQGRGHAMSNTRNTMAC